MRTGLVIISAMVVVGLLVGVSLPIASAQEADPGTIIFHVLPNETNGSMNLETIPGDAPDKIILAGNNDEEHTVAAFANLCEIYQETGGTPTMTPSPTPGGATSSVICEAVNVYYKITWSLTWDSGLEDGCGMWGVCERDVAPTIDIEYGGAGNLTSTSWGDCGEAAQARGSCNFEHAGMIPAEEIGRAITGVGDYWNERFDVSYSGGWGGGSYITTYTIILSTSPIIEECAGQYNIGAVLGSFTLAATNTAGVNLQTTLGMNTPAPGQWYAIHVTSGYWQNNGAGPQLRRLGMKSGPTGSWFPLTSTPSVECADTSTDTYYVQAFSTLATYLRVYDTDGNFAANTGSLTITISGVTAYTPYPSGCELQYEVGELIEQHNVEANSVNGWPLDNSKKFGTGGSGTDLQPQRYYMLETIGGPANLGAGVLTWDADLGPLDNEMDFVPDLWYEIQTAPFVTCVVQTDFVGHVKVFFAADSQATLKGPLTNYYKSFRVRDTGSYADNSGSLGYRLYEATNMQMTVPGEAPGVNGCNKYSHATATTGSLTIQANNAEGNALPTLTSRAMYALDVVGGPWLEGGVTDSYLVELSDDNGSSWTDLEDYSNLLCASSADGSHYTIYIYGAAGKIWKVRVNDVDNNFSTNTGSIGLQVYAGLTTINEWPACEDNYTFTRMALSDEERKIPGNMQPGKDIPASGISGEARAYALEITDESKWYEAGAGAGSYLVDISDDNGATWMALEDYTVICKEQLGDGDRFRIVFEAGAVGGERVDPPAPGNRKLRVRDGDNNFLSNTGYVMYQLFKAVAVVVVPGTPVDNSPPPPEWVVACNEKYSRPNGFFAMVPIGTISGVTLSVPLPRVGEWIDYLRNAITYYFAWCPQHTAALKSISDVAMNKEPMASIQDMMSFVRSIQTLLEGYQTLGGADTSVVTSQEPGLFADAVNIGQATGGERIDPPAPHGAGMWDLFVVGTFDPATNVWFGGKVDFNASIGSTNLDSNAAYEAACLEKYYPAFGIASSTVCKAFSLFRYSRIISILLLAMDLIIVVWWFFKYFPGYLKRFYNLITGNRGTIKRYVG